MPDEPGLTYSTGLLACAFRVTVAPAAASRMTLLVMLSWALSVYVPGARTMRPTAVLASALVRPSTVLRVRVEYGTLGGGAGGEGHRPQEARQFVCAPVEEQME
jgi:hypothetical protein